MFNFFGHMTSFATSQLCYCSMEVATDIIYMNDPLEYIGFQCWLWIPGNSREWIRNLRIVIQVLYKQMACRLNDVKAKAGGHLKETWRMLQNKKIVVGSYSFLYLVV